MIYYVYHALMCTIYIFNLKIIVVCHDLMCVRYIFNLKILVSYMLQFLYTIRVDRLYFLFLNGSYMYNIYLSYNINEHKLKW